MRRNEMDKENKCEMYYEMRDEIKVDMKSEERIE